MIHTAEEIRKSIINLLSLVSEGKALVRLSDVEKAINEARIEAIKECAEVARCKPMVIQDDFELAPPSTYYSVVDRQSILKLIDQIK